MSSPKQQPKSYERVGMYLLLLTPLLVAIMVMVPRLANPNFGLFDDGRTLVISREINQGTWDMSWDAAAGRFRPIYWLFYAFVYSLSGMNATGFFLANTVILAGIALLLISFTRLIGFSHFQSWVTAMVFVLSGPVIENFYTLSKAEPLQLLAISLGMVLAVLSSRNRHCLGKTLLLAGCCLSFLIAYLVKETTLVMVPVSATWVFLAWLRSLRNKNRLGVQPSLAILGASILAGGVFFIMRRLAVPVSLTGGSYSDQYSFTFERILASVIRWSGWLLRDFAFLIPLVLGVFILWLIYRRNSSHQTDLHTSGGFQKGYVFLDALLWMAAWIAVYLPWVYMQEYYALPFSAGAALAVGLVLGWLVELLKQGNIGPRIFLGLCALLAALLWLVTLPNNFSNAKIQLVVDDANNRMLTDIAQRAPEGSTVFVNIQLSNEYVEQMALYYLPKVYSRSELTTLAYQSQPLGVGSEYFRPDVIFAVPHIANQPLLAVRLGLYEPTQQAWNQALLDQMPPEWKIQSSIEEQTHLLIIDLPRIFCPFIRTRSFCSISSPLVDQRTFSYGWDLYQLQP